LKLHITKEEKVEHLKKLIIEEQNSINLLKFNLIKIQADIGLHERQKILYEKRLKKWR